MFHGVGMVSTIGSIRRHHSVQDRCHHLFDVGSNDVVDDRVTIGASTSSTIGQAGSPARGSTTSSTMDRNIVNDRFTMSPTIERPRPIEEIVEKIAETRCAGARHQHRDEPQHQNGQPPAPQPTPCLFHGICIGSGPQFSVARPDTISMTHRRTSSWGNGALIAAVAVAIGASVVFARADQVERIGADAQDLSTLERASAETATHRASLVVAFEPPDGPGVLAGSPRRAVRAAENVGSRKL